MRTSSRLVVSAAVLGGGLMLAAPASAQTACAYPFDCPPIGGVDEVPATGGGTPTVDTPTFNTPTFTGSGSGNPTSLPFTGGEITLLALGGVAALGGGAVLVAAGRKRATA
jgi:hypothetical protein